MKGNLFNVEIFHLKDEVIDGTPRDFSLRKQTEISEHSRRVEPTHIHKYYITLIPDTSRSSSKNKTTVRFWPIAVPRLRSARPSCPLIGWSLWDPGDLKGGDARHSVIKPLLHTTAVHHILDAGDGQRRLGHVSGDDTQTRSSGRRTENLNTQHI